jgi:ribosomal protein S18 acetylase RimI-like enzyme
MIAAPYRRQGRGAAVMAEVEQRIWENPGTREIWIAVQVNNPDGQRFWRSQGYQFLSGPEAQPDGTTVIYFNKPR